MKLLHVDSAITGDGSVSRALTAAITARLVAATPGAEVDHVDLAAAPLPHLLLSAMPGGDSAESKQSEAALEQFLAADTVVIGAPMYNFTLPSQLKAWIDRLLIAGRTFRYTATGPEGLAGDKRVIIAIARGGFYGEAHGNLSAEHLETYLKAAFGFIGIVPEFVIAEGIAIGPEQRAAALESGHGQVEKLAA